MMVLSSASTYSGVREMFELKKIGIVKRASALLLDAILLAVLATGSMFIISLIANYSHESELASQYYSEWEDFRKEYVPDVAEYYGFKYSDDGDSYTITRVTDGQAVSLNEVLAALEESAGNDLETAEAYQKYRALTPKDKVNAQYEYVANLLFMIISIGILFAYLILEFIIPLCLKNGQTIGKKIFGICLVKRNCVKIAPAQIFARTVLGKFAVETMFPVLLVFLLIFGGIGILAIVLLVALTILNIVLFFASKNRTPIHDVFANTVAVDMSVQMIFQSEEELVKKKTLQ